MQIFTTQFVSLKIATTKIRVCNTINFLPKIVITMDVGESFHAYNGQGMLVIV